jgi:hypothetical protein
MAKRPVPSDEHEWASFEDPEGHTWLFDLTFMTSNWTCIWGRGCPGVLDDPAPELEQGCCSYGAHFTEKADRKRVAKQAERLPARLWQHKRTAEKQGGPIWKNEEGEWVTRLVDDVCIFFNQPGFAGGHGVCAPPRCTRRRRAAARLETRGLLAIAPSLRGEPGR